MNFTLALILLIAFIQIASGFRARNQFQLETQEACEDKSNNASSKCDHCYYASDAQRDACECEFFEMYMC